MQKVIAHDTGRFLIERHGNGTGYHVIDRREGISASVQGDDAVILEAQLADFEEAHQRQEAAASLFSWEDCLAAAIYHYLEAANPDYEDWREAAMAAGWKVVERDPSHDAQEHGPCLHHEGQDRAMPLGHWRDAVLDLGYASPEEVLEEVRGVAPPRCNHH